MATAKGKQGEQADPQKMRRAIEEAWGAPLRTFHDPWRLLNTAEAEIRELAGRHYRAEHIDELVNMLEALRTLYRGVAAGDPVDLAQLFPEVEESLRHSLRTLYSGIYETAFFLDGVKIRRGLRRVDGLPKGPPWVIVDLADPLAELIEGLETITPRTVFVCENCGKIGPAERSDKRYCGGGCRKLASRKRLGS
jgi:hypothetical protein